MYGIYRFSIYLFSGNLNYMIYKKNQWEKIHQFCLHIFTFRILINDTCLIESLLYSPYPCLLFTLHRSFNFTLVFFILLYFLFAIPWDKYFTILSPPSPYPRINPSPYPMINPSQYPRINTVTLFTILPYPHSLYHTLTLFTIPSPYFHTLFALHYSLRAQPHCGTFCHGL